MKLNPLVSVIIPTYKRPCYLERAINSVLGQTYENIEIIVVDDNNPDTDGRKMTVEIMKIFDNNIKVKYIQHDKNRNGSAARNTGARHSRGEYLAFLDDDDIFMCNKISSQVEKMLTLTDEWGACYNKYYTQRPGETLILVKENREGDLFLSALKQELCISAGSNLLVRRAAFESINGFDESFKRNQDHEFLVRLLHNYKLAYVDEPGLIYSVGTTNVKINYEETINHYIAKFDHLIDNLPDQEKQEFYQNINRLKFYSYLRIEKNYRKAFRFILHEGYSPFDALKYLSGLGMAYMRRLFQRKNPDIIK